MKALLCKCCIKNATENNFKVGEKIEYCKKCYWCDETEVSLYRCIYDEEIEVEE